MQRRDATTVTRGPVHRLRTAGALGALLIGLAASQAIGGAATLAKTPPSVSVAYAGSLALVNDTLLGPAFTKATRIAYQGRGGGSLGLARELADHEFSAGVFESVGTGPLSVLTPRLTDWAVAVAGTPLVVAYSPQSAYAPEFRKIAAGKLPLSDLFRIMAKPGFRLARTNPATDPQGQTFVMMVHLADRVLHLPPSLPTRILGGLENRKQIFAEESELFEIQAGAVDAGSAFLPAAKERHLPYIVLGPRLDFADPGERALYHSVSVTLPGGKVVRGEPLAIYATALRGSDAQAGARFVAFLLSPAGKAVFRGAGYPSVTPSVWGRRSAVPAVVQSELGRAHG